MAIYNMTYVNQNQINYIADGYGSFSLANNGTSYYFTPEGGSTESGTVQYSLNGNDGIYTLQDATFTNQGVDYLISANGAFVRSLNNVLPDATGGTWTLEGGLPTMSPVVPINTTGNTYNLTWDSNSASIIDTSGTFIFNISLKSYEFLPTGGGQIISGTTTYTQYFNGIEIYTLSGHKGFVKHVGLYTAENKGTWTYQGTLPLIKKNGDIDLNSGFFETDLQTNITKYFAEAFKLKASDFEIVDGVVQINPEKLANITVDLTNIVNTSVETQNLTATNATLGTTTATNLTATTSSLGVATANSMTASDITAVNSTLGDAKADTIEVKNDGLIIEDAEGHKHKFGFTAN